MEFVLLWLLCGFIAMAIGARKGEGCGAFVLGCILGPFGIVAAALSRGDRAQCQFCKEMINEQAIVCPRCQRDYPLGAPVLTETIKPRIGKGPLEKLAYRIGRWLSGP